MPIPEIVTTLLLSAYCILILYYRQAWTAMAGSGTGESFQEAGPVTVSVIIPARNEEQRIGACIDAILAQGYPAGLVSIVVVDDESTDRTAAIASGRPRVRVVLLRKDEFGEEIVAFKKAAIRTGIQLSQGELILCTDADCIAPPDWIAEMVKAYRRRADTMLAGPVRIHENGSALAVFQVLDFISLQGITAAALSRQLYPMANGANLAYTRAAFQSVNGFEGIDHIASGDDMLLMKKMQDRFPGKQSYVFRQGAIVSTAPAENLRAFFRQRIRWASKTTHYGHPATMATLALVYLLNLMLLILAISCFFTGQWRWLLGLLVGKTTIEMLFVWPVAQFFGQARLMKYFPVCQPFHILYTVVAGGFGVMGKVTWKDRVVR